jgi:hypothetical protein
MKFSSFQDNSDSIVININNTVLRCDLHQRFVDHLHLKRHSHQRVLNTKPLKNVLAYDLESLLRNTHQLINEFNIPSHSIQNVFRHDRNDRFVLLECKQGIRLELDKELNGIRDRSKRSYSNMYKRRPDNYYRGAAIKEYQRIHHEIKRTFELAARIIQLKNGRQ